MCEHSTFSVLKEPQTLISLLCLYCPRSCSSMPSVLSVANNKQAEQLIQRQENHVTLMTCQKPFRETRKTDRAFCEVEQSEQGNRPTETLDSVVNLLMGGGVWSRPPSLREPVVNCQALNVNTFKTMWRTSWKLQRHFVGFSPQGREFIFIAVAVLPYSCTSTL